MDLGKITMYDACLLHSRAERVLKAKVTANLKDWDITRMEWLLLATAQTNPRLTGGHTMGELADMLDVRLSQMTALVNSMNEAKLIKQSVSEDDKRTRYVNITDKGRKLLSRIENSMRQAMRDWLNSIPRGQLAVYMKTVKELGR